MKKYKWLTFLILIFCVTAFTMLAMREQQSLSHGQKVYHQSCAGCHETGTANAPRRDDTDFWQARLTEITSASVLTNTVIEGSQGMPPKGGCVSCSENDIREAVQYMVMPAASNQPVLREDLALENLILPPGFKIEIFVDNIPGARTLALGKNGTIFVGTRGHGKVYALIPGDNGKIRVVTVLSDLNEPHGIAYHKGDLYVAEIQRIVKYPNIDAHLNNPPKPIILNDTLPHAKWHGYRVIGIGPDEQLYLAVGMPCNTCNYRTTVPIYGTISRMALSGGDITPYAIGVRNSVGFTWHPKTHDLWFTDNGQDLMGDEVPPDEINRADKAGLDFGFPYVIGDNELAPGYIKSMLPDHALTPPAFNLPAHVAPLGIMFYTGEKFPKNYQQQLFVALHGSWNRSKKTGYEIVQLNLEGDRVTAMKPFITGWLQPDETVLGRPVAMLELTDGSILISDDYNGAIYRVWYQP